MEKIIKLHDKEFVPFISAKEIEGVVSSLAEQINKDLKGQNPLFLVVLKGSFFFTADLVRQFEGNCTISFIQVSSYDGIHSTGQVKQLLGINEPLTNRTVVIIEDIIDTGNTLEYVYNEVLSHDPAQLKIASLLLKPRIYAKSIKIDYVGKEIPNKFIVGYGLDYNEHGRNLQDIYVVKN
jgi:hypoxanthine phosphoribosyltransferase